MTAMQSLMVAKPRDPFEGVAALAERLGVEPMGDGDYAFQVASCGKSYDVIKLVTALLDRLDAA